MLKWRVRGVARGRCTVPVAGAFAAALATALWAVLGATAAVAQGLPPPPIKAFYRPAELGQPTLSPSGRLLAVVSQAAGRRSGLLVLDLSPGGGLRQAARFSDIDIGSFFWVNEDRLVFDVIDREQASGEDRFAPGLFSVKPDGSELRQLVRLRSSREMTPTLVDRLQLDWRHRLLHVPSGGGDEVIVGEHVLNNFNELESVQARRLNVVTGRSVSMAAGMPAFGTQWLFDAAGQPRVITGVNKGMLHVHWRAPGQDDWAQIGRFEQFRAPWVPRYIDNTGQLYVTVAEGRGGTTVLKRFDFASGRPEGVAVVSTPGFDFTGSVVSETTGSRALGVRVTTDAETTVWFDARLKALQVEIDKQVPGRINRLSCRGCDSDGMTVLVESWSDRDPGQVFVWRSADRKLQRVGRVNQDIDPQRMAALDFERIKARDGRDLPLWLSKPADAPAGKPLPAVVLVHGGPWVRGTQWRWDPMVQFLNSRGYAVIQAEFRGSTGFGYAHFRAGWRQWGRAMQDDVADAVLWAAKAGHVDPQRVCIIGASYGGYATLMGLVRHPELYRCGAAWVAVTDPTLLFKWSSIGDVSEEARSYQLPVLLGDPVADAALLQEVSPVAQAARIKAPVLLAFGGLDRRVPLEHGTLMRRALREAGNDPEWVVYPGEGHSWRLVESRLDFARRLEKFLAQHLK
jgi:acetyl esterase/lipase